MGKFNFIFYLQKYLFSKNLVLNSHIINEEGFDWLQPQKKNAKAVFLL